MPEEKPFGTTTDCIKIWSDVIVIVSNRRAFAKNDYRLKESIYRKFSTIHKN